MRLRGARERTRTCPTNTLHLRWGAATANETRRHNCVRVWRSAHVMSAAAAAAAAAVRRKTLIVLFSFVLEARVVRARRAIHALWRSRWSMLAR